MYKVIIYYRHRTGKHHKKGQVIIMEKLYIETPLIEVTQNTIPGKTVSFKMEAYQPSGSFKLRGMDCACRSAAENGCSRFLSSSGGNAGLAVAYCGRKLGIPVTVVLPETSSRNVIARLESLGSEVIVRGRTWDDANEYCLGLCSNDETIAYIPPFDDPHLWHGHSSLVDELKKQCAEQPDLIILSVGGGGLLNGVVEGLVRSGWEDTAVLAVETKGADSLYQSAQAGKLVTLSDITSVAKSLGARTVARKALDNVQAHNVIPYLTEDSRAVSACVRMADEYRVIVEPACGASLSVFFDRSAILNDYKNIVVIVCGGSNVDLGMIETWSKTE
jgi:Threonine dehydratase